MDYIAGNTGTNSFFGASDTFPLKLYAKDFDNNGSIDPIITVYLKDEQGNRKEFPAFNRDDIVNQLPYLKKKFLTYKEFGAAGIHEIFDDDELKDAQVLQANCLSSAYIENAGNGKFQFHGLPVQAQLAPLNGMIADDFNNDGNLDIAVCGNDFGNEVTDGRYDAMNGLVLSGDGKGNFAPQTILQSGFFIPGDAKALVSLRGAGNRYLIAASQNRDALKLFCKKDTAQIFITVNTNDKIVLLTLYDGSTRKQELYYGNSFLSQAARFVCIGSHIKKAAVVDNSGIERIVFSR
ncbi:MAG TPA: RNA-binding protein, partial [Chitinophagaceae bacterium]|nr:RNA-binding protein [Chitinophagaceae bacterium]